MTLHELKELIDKVHEDPFKRNSEVTVNGYRICLADRVRRRYEISEGPRVYLVPREVIADLVLKTD